MPRSARKLYIQSQRDLDSVRDDLIDALQRGFGVDVVLPFGEWTSENASFIRERVTSEIQAAIRRHELKQFHFSRVRFQTND
jgi:hypothetical protein